MGSGQRGSLDDERLVHLVQAVALVVLALLTAMLCWLALTAV